MWKHERKAMLSSFLRILSITLAFGNAAHSAELDIFVSYSHGVDSLGCGTALLPCKTITMGLSLAGDYSTLWLAPGTYPCSGSENGFVVSNLENVSFTAWQPTEGIPVIDCDGKARAFYVTGSSSASFSNLVVRNASAAVTSSGGAFLIDAGCNASFVNVSFENNIVLDTSAGSGGGAIYASNANLFVANCSFVGNSAAFMGGAIGFVTNNTNSDYSIVISGSQFEKNVVKGLRAALGAGVSIYWNSPTSNVSEIYIVDNVFNQNSGRCGQGPSRGASVSITFNKIVTGSLIRLIGNTHTHNSLVSVQGDCDGAATSIYFLSTVVNAKAIVDHEFYLSNSALSSQQGTAMGGAISIYFVDKSSEISLSVGNTIMKNNTALTEGSQGLVFGGAVAVWFDAPTSGFDLILSHSSFALNSAGVLASGGSSLGGAVSVVFNDESSNTSLSCSQLTFSNNNVTAGGEGSALGGGLSLFYNDQTTNASCAFNASSFDGNSVTGYGSKEGSALGGGASVFFNVASQSSFVSVSGCTFEDNIATLENAEGTSIGGGFSSYQSPATVKSTTFLQNIATECPNVFTPSICS
jgi:hypothetical protein